MSGLDALLIGWVDSTFWVGNETRSHLRKSKRRDLSPEELHKIVSAPELADYSGSPFVIPHPPLLGLTYVATAADQAGYAVRIIDNVQRYDWRFEQVKSICQRDSPRVLGVSTSLAPHPRDVREFIVNRLRPIAGDAKIVLGGETARRWPKLHRIVDHVVFGSGEQPFVGILDALSGKRDIDSVPWITYWKDGELRYTEGALSFSKQPQRPMKTDPCDKTTTIPDWSLYPRSRAATYPIEFSRGCNNNCYFCSQKRGKRIRTLQDIRRELVANKRLGIAVYRIADADFGGGPPGHKQFAHEVCQTIIDAKVDCSWTAYCRVSSMNAELAKLMVRSGGYSVIFGIESANDSVLRLMHKGHTATEAADAIRIAKEAGLLVSANFIVGFPGETRETAFEILAFCKRTRPDSVMVTPFYAITDTPVVRFRDRFQLEGQRSEWSHPTMCRKQAEEIVIELLEALKSEGLYVAQIGSEASFYLGYGFAADKLTEMFRLRSSGSQTDRARAGELLREFCFGRLPGMLAQELEVMRHCI